MHIVLINPNTSIAKGINKATIEPPLGIGYLATYLRQEGFSCSLIDANILHLSQQQILNRISPDTKIIGISFNIVSAVAAFELVKYLKSRLPGVTFIAGGPHPSSVPELCLNESEFDVVCIGEGEETLLEIAKNTGQHKLTPLEGVNGICYRNNGRMIKTPSRSLIKDLDIIPFVDYGLFPELSLYRSRARAKPVGVILTSRGCPYQCIYCNKNIFHATNRTRSVENVISEIEQQIARFGVKQIDFLDDNLTLDIKYANHLFDGIIKRNLNLYINLQNGVRADLLDEGLIKKMKQAGVFKVSIGVESGDEYIQKLIRKNLDLQKTLKSTRLLKKHGIRVYGNFMLGLPYDTQESMQKTIDFAIKMDPDIANFMITIPFPGTELYELIKKEGEFFECVDKGISQGFYGKKIFYRLKGMDTERVFEYYKKSYRKFYFRIKKILEIITSVNSVYELRWFLNATVEVSRSILSL